MKQILVTSLNVKSYDIWRVPVCPQVYSDEVSCPGLLFSRGGGGLHSFCVMTSHLSSCLKWFGFTLWCQALKALDNAREGLDLACKQNDELEDQRGQVRPKWREGARGWTGEGSGSRLVRATCLSLSQHVVPMSSHHLVSMKTEKCTKHRTSYRM